jgi:hypothetical protein
MTARTYAGRDRLSCRCGHRVELLWTNRSSHHLFSEMS